MNTLQSVSAAQDQIGTSAGHWRKVAIRRGELLQDSIRQIDEQSALLKRLNERVAELEAQADRKAQDEEEKQYHQERSELQVIARGG